MGGGGGVCGHIFFADYNTLHLVDVIGVPKVRTSCE